jgi:hypothetical protein
VTILFSMYLQKQHYHVTRFLAMEDCVNQDEWMVQENKVLTFWKRRIYSHVGRPNQLWYDLRVSHWKWYCFCDG